MTQAIRSITVWVFLLGAASVLVSAQKPSQNFKSTENLIKADENVLSVSKRRFSYPSKPSMSRAQVASVFRDHLVGFPRSHSDELAAHLLRLATRHQFDPALILSLIQVESSFRVSAISPVGAVGLMQLMPPTANEVAGKLDLPYRGVEDLHNPFINMTLGVTYLAFLRDYYDGKMTFFLGAYNAGPGRMDGFLRRNIFYPKLTQPYVERIEEYLLVMRTYGRPPQEDQEYKKQPQQAFLSPSAT
jgi:soluble lytic murein transglycosylase-like protein